MVMPKIKPIVPRTPEELAEALGLSIADAKGWQAHYKLLKRIKAPKKLAVKGAKT
jgi:hypothetical protein